MFYKIIFLLSFLIMLQSTSSLFGQDKISKTDYEIYSQSLVDLNYCGENESVILVNKTLYFGNSSSYNDMFGYYKRVSEIVNKDKTLADSFDKLPEESLNLEVKFNQQLKFLLVDESEIEITDIRGGWENFYRRYSGFKGIVQFSAIAYNPERNKSLHYVLFKKDKSWIDGFFISYSLKNDKWVLLEKIRVFHLRPEKSD